MPDKQKEARDESYKKLIQAYKKVFGVEGSRTVAQQMVWEDMIERWRVESASFVANTELVQDVHSHTMKNVVTYDPIKAALTDGAKLPFFQIKAFCSHRSGDEPKKPNVKR